MDAHNVLPDEAIISKIHLIRGQKVMLDSDLAGLFGVLTKNLNKAVQRNSTRFPEDFMFRLTAEEADSLRFQSGTSKRGGRRYMPYAFTEQGVAMLASVLNSDTAIEVNIRIIRIFTHLRGLLLAHKDVLLKLEQLERQLVQQGDEIATIFEALKGLLHPTQKTRTPIGFKIPQPG